MARLLELYNSQTIEEISREHYSQTTEKTRQTKPDRKPQVLRYQKKYQDY